MIFTTVPVFRDCIKILLESQPNSVDGALIKTQIENLEDVEAVDDMHTWALAGNKHMMTCHVRLSKSRADNEQGEARTKRVYDEIKRIVRKQDICHFTAQIL